MKRCRFGASLLVLLLTLGLITSCWMGRFSFTLSKELCSAAALTGENRAAAQASADQTFAKWEGRRKLTSVLADHAPMEEIQANFTLLTPEAEDEDFRETCLRLSAQLEALGESQLLTLENLF